MTALSINTSVDLPIVKFQSNERIECLRNGKVYLRNLSWFRKREKKTGDMTVGDMYEGMLHIANGNAKITCLSENPLSDYDIIKESAFETVFSNSYAFCATDTTPHETGYAFNKQNKVELRKFGDTALVINDRIEFIKRIENKARTLGFKTFYGLVRYYNNDIDPAEMYVDLLRGIQNIALWKRDSYYFQKEFRIVLWKKDAYEDHLELDIGEISDISNIFTAEEALSMHLERHVK